MALVSKKVDPIIEGRRLSWGTRTGTRTAEDFTITLGFQPTHIRVVNLTTRAEGLHIVDPALDGGANVKGILTVAAGTRTYAATGIAPTADGLGFTVTVATASLETNDSDVYWEAWQ
jgi:hypothetical protein